MRAPVSRYGYLALAGALPAGARQLASQARSVRGKCGGVGCLLLGVIE